MAPRCGLARPLRCACLLAALQQLALAAESSVRSGAVAIPSWRIDAALHPSRTLRTLLTDQQTTDSQAVAQLGSPVGSTLGQDRQRCPLVKLPSTVVMKPEQSSWSGQSGIWESMGNGVQLATWGQNYFAQGWQTIYIRNYDGKDSVKAEVRSYQELKQMYSWRPGPPIASYPNVSDLQQLTEATAYHGFKVENDGADGVKVVAIKPPEVTDLSRVMAFSDCEGQLLFVAVFEANTHGDRPMMINVFDRAGNLLAHSLVDDPAVTRYQFIDPNGFLLATAEAPGLHQNIPTASIPLDPTKGSIMPFEIHFEAGGYGNASRLLDMDYHWVLATAVQASAITQAHGDWTPRLSSAITVVYWCLVGMGFILCLCAAAAIYRLVYPSGHSAGPQQPLWTPKPRYAADGSYASFNKAV